MEAQSYRKTVRDSVNMYLAKGQKYLQPHTVFIATGLPSEGPLFRSSNLRETFQQKYRC